ncbi:hypothetical protein Ahy_B02g057826 [Arachis hypogaea]|uniref:Transposase MuDR plant domain-containing protein n=1 Tax=Arachis hypogaea TaxID=3818 RepID=A0A445AD14_ARAHY|nr:hypothetical protein Ahy_B02g057826 [Arachis hypogaea]
MNNDSNEEFEAGDEDEDDDEGDEAVAETLVVPAAVSQPMDLGFCAMHAPEFSEYTNIGVANPEDGEFRIRIEYGSKKSVIVVIRSYTISRGVNYITFYAKGKTYGCGCDCLIRASLIQKKACWEIWRYYGKHTCSMGTIS